MFLNTGIYTVGETAKKVCPDGWHLPSETEWTELVNYIAADGYSNQEGNALKAITGWHSDGNGVDIYKFNALPGGIRYHGGGGGSFDLAGYRSHWWSSDYSSSHAYYRYLVYNSANVNVYGSNKLNGLSVRCIKN